VMTMQQTQEATEKYVSEAIARLSGSSTSSFPSHKRTDLSPAPPDAPRKSHRGARGGSTRTSESTGAATQGQSLAQTRIARLSSHTETETRAAAQLSALAQTRQRSNPNQTQRAATTSQNQQHQPSGQQQQQQPQQQQQQQQQSHQPPPQQQQLLGGARGRLSVIEELDNRYYAGTPRDQRPCGWQGLFGACNKDQCSRCANGLQVPIAQVRAMERACEASLAQQIRAARP
jgi:hypothetical protein